MMNTILVLGTVYALLLAGLGFEQSRGEESRDNDTMLEPDRASHRWFGPVMQNHSALMDWLSKTKHGRKIKERNAGGMPPFIPSLECDKGKYCNQPLCPWTIDYDDDPKRIPRFIEYARCDNADTAHCNFQNMGWMMRTFLENLSSCKEVTKDFCVYENGRMKLMTVWPIACICTWHKTEMDAGDVTLTTGDVALDANTARFDQAPHTASSEDYAERWDDYSCQNDGRDAEDQYHVPDSQPRDQRRRSRVSTESFQEMMARRRKESRN